MLELLVLFVDQKIIIGKAINGNMNARNVVNAPLYEVALQCTHVHMVDSLLKRWTNGTHQGRISSKHLEFYLDEYAFRFNRKLSTYRGEIFYRLVQMAVATAPVPLKILIGNENKLHV